MAAKMHPSRAGALPAASGPSPMAIHAQMVRIMNAPALKATDAQRAFLRFVIGKSLAGQSEEIKGYTVATEVFSRRKDFDQATDPIVSIQANKLRRALDLYYLSAGRQDPIRIDIPKGTYVPVFYQPGDLKSGKPFQNFQKPKPIVTNAWPTRLVKSFENLTGDRKLEYIGIGLATEISLEIMRYQEIRVLMQGPEARQRRVSDIGARFVLGGSVKKDRTRLKVNVSLVDMSTGIQIWGDSHRADLKPAQLIAFEEKIATTVAGKISCEDGVIAKTLSLESKKTPPSELETYQAMLRYYQFNLDFTAEAFLSAYEALQQACKNEPECGLVWSMLARLYSVNYSLELFDLETPLEKAASFAERGVKLDPANQRARLIMAFVQLFKNERSAGLAEIDRALALNPNALIYKERIGYLMTLFGDWKRGPRLIEQAIKCNPYYNITVHYALWVDWVRQEKYDRAYHETLNFRTPMLFWDPLMKAAGLGLLGKTAEGMRSVDDLLELKPDFHTNGRVLIRHYIKFDDIVDRVIDGLGRVGIDVE
jgi:TolB-like protein